MHDVLYAYAIGAGAVGSADSDTFFARCAVCDMYGTCADVSIAVIGCPAGYDSELSCTVHVWRVCESCQYAAEYGCDCEVCGFCRSVECARVRRVSDAAGIAALSSSDIEGVKVN